MTIIKRSAVVAYTPRQMFELVNSIEEYPRFLPWCRQSHILTRTAAEVKASLEIVWSGIHKSFTTRNHLHPHEKIEIELVEGPFRHLEGRWEFVALGEHGCKVNLALEFELTGHVFDRIFQPIFHHIANSLVDAFCRRAANIYANG
ncbi:MAG: cyclase/dehydrase [uncultured bacterium]|nr:MAG: cyclase/dehydrase [uncultured bacterium]